MKMNKVLALLAFTAMSATGAFAQDAQQMAPQGMAEGTQSFDSSAQLSAAPAAPVTQPTAVQQQPVAPVMQPVSQVAHKIVKKVKHYAFPSSAPKSLSDSYKYDNAKPFNESAAGYQPVEYKSGSSAASYYSDAAISSAPQQGNVVSGSPVSAPRSVSSSAGYVTTPGKSENFEVVNPNVNATVTTNPVPTRNADYTDGGSAPTLPVSGLTVQTSSGAQVIKENTKVFEPSRPSTQQIAPQGNPTLIAPVSAPDQWRNPDYDHYGSGSRGNGGANHEINKVTSGSFFFSINPK